MVYIKGEPPSHSRRDFLKLLGSATALACSGCAGIGGDDDPGNQGSRIFPPREKISNPFITGEGKPILVCVEGTDFSLMLRKGLDALGDLGKLIGNREVFIKPNFVEKSRYPWISSLDSVLEIIQTVKELTAGAVKLGEMSYESTESVYEYLGLDEAIDSVGGTLLRLKETRDVKRGSWSDDKPAYHVYADIHKAPVIINTCVLKRHLQASMTNAIKCHVGCIKGSNCTYSRKYMHEESGDLLAEIAEVAGLINPELNIVDARSIVTGKGPLIIQEGLETRVDKIVLCGDIVATDAYCAQIMAEKDGTFTPLSIKKTLDRAVELGMGTADLNQVEIKEISA